MQRRKKAIALALSLATVACLGIGGTLAWLTDKTDVITNKFTASTIDVDLVETNADGGTATENAYQMVPGATIDKDPVVIFGGDKACEASWVFLVVDKSDNFDSFMECTIVSDWKQLKDANGKDVPGVYYDDVEETAAKQQVELKVLEGDKVTVLRSVTKSDMDALTSATYPTIAFKAYATQMSSFEDNPYGAWQATQATN